MKIKKILLMLIALEGFLASKHDTLNDLAQLAATYTEDVEPDNTNFEHPDFSNFLKTLRPSLFRRLFGSWGELKKHFSIQELNLLLKEVTENQKKLGRSGNFIVGTQVALEDKIVIFGTIQGAFHSLIRDLQELQSQGVIDNNLKIIKPGCHIIFNGTVVARSPFILQTLYTILLLMKQNPDRVFYLKSDFEQRELWNGGGFSRQLDVIYRHYADQTTSLFKSFVAVLPSAFYANYAENPEDLFECSALESFAYDARENETNSFFYTLKRDEISVWNLNNKIPTEKPVHTNIFIDCSDPNLKMQSIESLMFLEPIGAASVWRVFSAATTLYNKMYKFKDDSFVTIVFGKILNSSIIELYARNRFTQDPFKLKGSFEINIDIPQKATPESLNFIEKKIYIGSSLDLSKSNFIMGNRVRTGILAAIKQANGSPELLGKEIKDIILDDQYTPRLARKNIEQLQKEFGIDTFLLPIGTPTILAVNDLITSGKILAAFPVTGSQVFRTPEIKGVVNFRPSYEVEVEKLIKYLLDVYKFKKFAFFYQDDEYGIDCLKKAREVLLANGISKWIEIPYARNTTNFVQQRELLKKEQVEALGCFSASQPTQEFLRQVDAANLVAVKVFALAFVVDDVFEAFVKNDLGLKCLFSRLVPNPKLSTLELVAEYRLLMDQLKRPYDVYSLEGYICTSILCEMIKKSTGPISHTTLLAQLEAVNNFDFKGLTLNFDPTNRQVSNRIWFDFQDGNDWLEVL